MSVMAFPRLDLLLRRSNSAWIASMVMLSVVGVSRKSVLEASSRALSGDPAVPGNYR